jgi:C-terminal processing protease CtpA/Prc
MKRHLIVIEDTVYVGQSGGLENNYTVDKKNKDIEKGRLQTIFHQRMKAHSTAFNKENTKEIKYKLFHETYGYGNQIHRGDLTGKFLCVCIIVPA